MAQVGHNFVRTTSGTAYGTRGHSGGGGGRTLRVPLPPAPFLGGRGIRVFCLGVVLRREDPQPSIAGRASTCTVATLGSTSTCIRWTSKEDCAGLWELAALLTPQRANFQTQRGKEGPQSPEPYTRPQGLERGTCNPTDRWTQQKTSWPKSMMSKEQWIGPEWKETWRRGFKKCLEEYNVSGRWP